MVMLIFDGACVWKRGALSARPRLSQADRSGSDCCRLSLLAALASRDDTLSPVRELSVSAKGPLALSTGCSAIVLDWRKHTGTETQGYALPL